MAGAERSAALAAIGKGEGTQAGTVLLIGGRRADFFLGGRKMANFRCGTDQVGANGAVRGPGSLQKSEI